jgi:protein-S-isoprenylcysteine O-methyltransferase Ste14
MINPDMASTLSIVAFVLSFGGGALLITLALVGKTNKSFEFFPPPSKDSWQHTTFISLFRLFVYSLIALSVLRFEHSNEWGRIIVGSGLLAIGFCLAFFITFQMGWRNAFGEKRGLQTKGWFRFSRNPVYVATWVGLVGWGIVVPDFLVIIVLTVWGLIYLLAPFLEEPWLERMYGTEYLAYRRRTRRFL